MTIQELRRFVPRPGMKALVVGNNHEWAKADSGKEAYADCSRPSQWYLMEVHPAVWVDGMQNVRTDSVPRELDHLPDDDIVKMIGSCIK